MKLAVHHDTRLYARVFQQFGRLHIPDLLRQEDAQAMHETLATATPWNVTVIHNDLVYDVPPDQFTRMTDDEKRQLEAEVYQFASRQYEGKYRTSRLSDYGEPYEGGNQSLRALTQFLNDSHFLDFVREVTGLHSIHFADAQATCFEPGDFLHRHIDVLEDKNRLAAYVLNLTPNWQAEWGGLLNFLAADGHVAEAYTPAWNALNIFSLESWHFVSCVAPFAAAKRYSITGWLRMK